MERIVRTDLHAYAAANAPLKKVFFIERAGRSDEPRLSFHLASCRAAQQRQQRHAGNCTGDAPAALQIRFRGGFIRGGKETKTNVILRTDAHTIHTERAFGLAPFGARNRIVTTLAMQQTFVALLACAGAFFQTEDRLLGKNSQQCAERT
jgi:hypothetical protein